MKRITFLILLPLIVVFSIISQDNTISLANKKQIEKIDENNLENKDALTNIIKTNKLLPKSFYIGELGDFYSTDINRNNLIKFVDDFFKSNSNKRVRYIENDFTFIYKTVYENIFNNSDEPLKKWIIGYPNIHSSYAELSIELHFENILYTGVIYLNKLDSNWLITDLQIELQEKEVFDPSSPGLY